MEHITISNNIKWSEYEKQIATDDYYYVRSCIRQNFFPGSEAAFLNIMQNDLGVNIFDDPLHTSCTGIGYHTDIVPLETIMTVVARQFSLMCDAGKRNFVASCVTSFGVYVEIIETWKHFPETLERTRRLLKEATGRTFEVPDSVAHTSDVVYHHRNAIAEKAKFRLVNRHTGEPLKVVDHIGCHYNKLFPSYSHGGGEFPKVLRGMVEAWGGVGVDYPERRHCCGFGFRNYLVMANRSYSISSSKRKFESMKPYEPDFIVANCPGCAMFLDRWQYALNEMEGATYGQNGRGIPVLTYEEMMGLVMGYNPWDLGLQMHQVDVEILLDKIGIEYDEAAKFLDKDGNNIGRPEPITLNNCGCSVKQ